MKLFWYRAMNADGAIVRGSCLRVSLDGVFTMICTIW